MEKNHYKSHPKSLYLIGIFLLKKALMLKKVPFPPKIMTTMLILPHKLNIAPLFGYILLATQ